MPNGRPPGAEADAPGGPSRGCPRHGSAVCLERMRAVGYHPSFTKLLVNSNTSMGRYFKVHGRYSEAVTQHNGLGQGLPLSSLIALVYVGVQTVTVEATIPSVTTNWQRMPNCARLVKVLPQS